MTLDGAPGDEPFSPPSDAGAPSATSDARARLLDNGVVFEGVPLRCTLRIELVRLSRSRGEVLLGVATRPLTALEVRAAASLAKTC